MTELQQAAARAWAAMDDSRSKLQRMVDQMAGDNRGPMPADFALDMVQNVTGDRDDAITALVAAGADWLESQTVPSDRAELNDACLADAALVFGYVRGESLGLALTHLGHIEERCRSAGEHPAYAGQFWALDAWLRWVKKARHVVDRCKLIAAAAYPEQAA